MADLFFQNGAGSPADGSITRAKLAVGAVAPMGVTTITAGFTALPDIDMVFASAAATYSIAVPLAASAIGKRLWFQKTDDNFNIIRLGAFSNDLVNGTTFANLATRFESVCLVSNGSSYWAVATRNIPSTWTSYTPTLTGFGTPSTVTFDWRRVGSAIQIRGRFTLGTSTATEARATLPTGLVSADTTTIPSLRLAGYVASSRQTDSNRCVLMEPSVAYVTFGLGSGASSETSKVNGDSFGSSGDVIYLDATIPIAGWQA